MATFSTRWDWRNFELFFHLQLQSCRSTIQECNVRTHVFLPSTSLRPANSPNLPTQHFPVLQPRTKTHKIRHFPINDGSQFASKKEIRLPPNVRTITSTSNPFVKHCVKLRQSSSYRHFHGSVLIVGAAPIREIFSFHRALIYGPTVECFFVLENCSIPEEIDHDVVRVVEVNSEVIRKISGVQSVDSVQVIALLRIPSTFHIVSSSLEDKDCYKLFSSAHHILILEGIQDPGNLGTLLRSATAFKWDGVFLLPGCCDPFNDKALRACRGSCFQIPIISGTWADVKTLRGAFHMKMLAGHPAMIHGQNPVMTLSKDFASSIADLPLCLVLGSEGAGISQFTREVCELVTIPMAGEFESLNVSVAGGIFMYMLQNKDKPSS